MVVISCNSRLTKKSRGRLETSCFCCRKSPTTFCCALISPCVRVVVAPGSHSWRRFRGTRSNRAGGQMQRNRGSGREDPEEEETVVWGMLQRKGPSGNSRILRGGGSRSFPAALGILPGLWPTSPKAPEAKALGGFRAARRKGELQRECQGWAKVGRLSQKAR